MSEHAITRALFDTHQARQRRRLRAEIRLLRAFLALVEAMRETGVHYA